ncbi:MAG: twin-arginine translocation signal domain-containing protein [Burkholderiaceae bacterium]|nr:twin-arginine translocation signal domain-containing protein [Burkholderiaceae bacterium]
MSRREFLAKTGAAAVATGAAAVAAPAIAQSDVVRWRCASSFPKGFDTLYGTLELIARRVNQLTGGKFQISTHAAGEIVPPFQVLDAVEKGTIEANHTAPYYFIGKDPAWAFGTCIPFGLNARQMNAWWYHGDGEKVFNEFSRKSGVVNLLAGNTGSQMAGWFKKELKTVEELKGLKFRTGGMGGQVLAKLGVVTQQIPAGEIYSALEKGTIDAAEFTVPYDDERLGLNKIAKYYYYPGFWEGGAALGFQVNAKAYDALPDAYKAALQAACAEGNSWMQAKYDTVNPQALKRLIAGGAVLRRFPKSVMDASFKANNELMAENSAKSPEFKKLFDHMRAFHRDQQAWFRVAEGSYDDFMATQKL